MTLRPPIGRGIFYTRDSEGRSELAPPQYVDWARREAAKLGVTFTGTPETMSWMVSHRASVAGDLYLDYGISGNHLSRPGFDAFRTRAIEDTSVSHLFIPRRDRFARPDNPLEAMQMECDLRKGGLAIVMMDCPILPAIPPGSRFELADLLMGTIAFEQSGKFRSELAEKLIHAKVQLAQGGFSIGGDAVYGFQRWLVDLNGNRRRELTINEIVKMPGHHVVWLPTAVNELANVSRILDLIELTPVGRIARMFNDEGIPSPFAGRTRRIKGKPTPISGLWTGNTIKNIATHPLLCATREYGHRSEGDQRRFTPNGPRFLDASDYGPDGKLKSVRNPADRVMVTSVNVEPLLTVERREQIQDVLEKRGQHLRGKPRARNGAANPLGGRIYDMNCGWLMYRTARRGRWYYGCALYQNSHSKCCEHNTVPGELSTRVVLACLKQTVLNPRMFEKLRAKLSQLASADSGPDPVVMGVEQDKMTLAKVTKQLKTVAKNMALAETEEERSAMKDTFQELKLEEKRLNSRIARISPAQSNQTQEQEVDAALNRLHQLTELANSSEAAKSVSELFQAVNVRLYLGFRKVKHGNQERNKVRGGVLTIGSTEPPVPLYDGPTDRPQVLAMLNRGESVSPILGCVAPGVSEAGTEDVWSANVQRVTRRCSGRRGRDMKSSFQVSPAAAVGELGRPAELRRATRGRCFPGQAVARLPASG